MPAGIITHIHLAPAATAPMQSVSSCTALPGLGLADDRYAKKAGTFSTWPKDHELTLIEAETLDALAAAGFPLPAGATRRNLTTRGISLNHLVNKEFTIGPVRCKGTRLCPPCDHLEKLLQLPGLITALTNRGGLRAIILTPGTISIGDPLQSEPVA